MRAKICKKEAKESRYWLRLIEVGNNQELINEQQYLIGEATELMKIFGAMIEKSTKNKKDNK